MNKNFLCYLLMFCISILVSCGRDDDFDLSPQKQDLLHNLSWIEGSYSGSYYTLNATANTNDEFEEIFINRPWHQHYVTAKIELNPDTTINIKIRDGYSLSWTNRRISINADSTVITCGKYEFKKKSEFFGFYQFEYGTYGGFNSGGWVRGEELRTYKIN